ncbi:MAG: type II toxin-antitoxin system HicA family toxin [Oscillospiraceae bacterium]|nr:type II toxin-antitoxin system HicA family toxin [Oscillospiraceae bacterium]
MSKLALVSANDMCKILEMHGMRKLRQKGSHAFYLGSGGNMTVVPMHTGDLKRSLIRQIISQAGISISEYEKLRNDV